MTIEALAKEAAKHWGGTPETLISNRENAVFRMLLPNGQTAALRLHRMGYQTSEAIQSELWFCDALAKQGLPVPRPLKTQNGALLKELGNGRVATSVEWLQGAPLGAASIPLPGSSQDQSAQHFALGVLLAKIHTATEALALPADFKRPAWDIDGFTGETPFWGRFWEHPALTRAEALRFQDVRGYLRGALQVHAAALIPIHADVLRENILVAGENLALIDFDDCGMGFPLYDLGTVLSQNINEPHRIGIRAGLIEGYQTIRPVDPAMVDVFTLARCMASVGWTMPRLAPDDPIMRSHIKRALQCADLVM